MKLDPNALLIIIGAVFILLGAAGKIALEKLSLDVVPTPLRIAISVFGLILLALGVVGPENIVPSQKSELAPPSEQISESPKLPPSKKLPEPEPTDSSGADSSVEETGLGHQGHVTITRPRNGASVSSGIEVTGTYTKEVKEDIWVMVWPEKARGRGWPQSEDAAAGVPAWKQQNRWSVYCHFGGLPQSFEIAVYTATRSASVFLGDKLKEWYRQNDYQGISARRLPQGLVEKGRIRVTKVR